MLGKTHYVIGESSCLILFPPTSLTNMILQIVVSSIGAGISDIDISPKAGRRKITEYTLLGLAMFAYISHKTILHLWRTNPFSLISVYKEKAVLLLIFVGLCIIGSHTQHRTFTHSFLFLGLTSLIIYRIYPIFVPWYACGFISHIVLDLLNKRPITPFFPFGGGNCLYLCKSKGRTDSIIFYSGFALTCIVAIKYLIEFLPILQN